MKQQELKNIFQLLSFKMIVAKYFNLTMKN